MRLYFIALASVIGFSLPAGARVFDISKETLASYLLVSGAQSNLKSTPFADDVRNARSYSDSYTTDTGAEFGFVYMKGFYGLRFGFEILKPTGVEGQVKDGGSANLYRYSNTLTVLTPKIGADINFYTGSSFRFSAFGFFGSAGLSGTTEFSQVTVAPSVAHSVEMRSTAPTAGGGLLFEFAAFDTTSLVLELAYRQLKFNNVKHVKDVTTFSGAVTTGDEVKNSDGTARQIDFTGAYVTFGMRVYLF